MNMYGSTGITAITMLSGIILSGAASSVLLQNTDDLSSNATQMLNDVIDEITTYLKLDDIIGKYYIENGTRCVERLVILVKQPIKTTLNISTITIKISNKEDVLLLGYSGYAQKYDANGVFENSVWNMTYYSFSLIILNDNDNSIQEHHIMNGDTVFVVIRLPIQFQLGNDDTLTLSILPEKGIMRSIVLETPSIHLSDIINFRDE